MAWSCLLSRPKKPEGSDPNNRGFVRVQFGSAIDEGERKLQALEISMEGLKVSKANLMVYLHPSKAKHVSQAILSELSSHLFKYNETFDGVLLAYDANTPNNLAKMLPGIHPYFGVRVEARLLLFYPKPDMLLEGKVVKLGEQSLHIVVLGFSSATIIEEDIREEFHFKVKHGEEVFVSTVNKRHKIKVGSMVRFVVKSFDEEILHISGSLLPAHTGSIRWLNKNTEDLLLADSNSKKRGASQGDMKILKHDNMVANADLRKHKLKKKKLKSSDS